MGKNSTGPALCPGAISVTIIQINIITTKKGELLNNHEVQSLT